MRNILGTIAATLALLMVVEVVPANADESYMKRVGQAKRALLPYGAGSVRKAGGSELIEEIHELRDRITRCSGRAGSRRETTYMGVLRKEISDIDDKIQEKERMLRQQEASGAYPKERMAKLWEYHEETKTKSTRQRSKLEKELAGYQAEIKEAQRWWNANRADCERQLARFEAIVQDVKFAAHN